MAIWSPQELALQTRNVNRLPCTRTSSFGLGRGVGPQDTDAEALGRAQTWCGHARPVHGIVFEGGTRHQEIALSVVLDEADRMMDMGFMPQLRDMLEVIPRKRQNLLFSATFPQRVERLADEFLLWPSRIEVTPEGTPVASVEQYVVRAQRADENQCGALVDGCPPRFSGAVVCSNQRGRQARSSGFGRGHASRGGGDPLQQGPAHPIGSHVPIPSWRSQGVGQHGRECKGIDVPETEVVINFNVPRMSDDYVHRIGRTGRADRSGMAYTLVDPTDEVALVRVVERLPAESRPQRFGIVLPGGSDRDPTLGIEIHGQDHRFPKAKG